jgi:hypothetical protein
LLEVIVTVCSKAERGGAGSSKVREQHSEFKSPSAVIDIDGQIVYDLLTKGLGQSCHDEDLAAN